MARPLRIQYFDALYHVMNRGVGRNCIYQNDDQRLLFLSLLEEITLRYHVEIHAYCLMGNHYHLLIKTPFANLDRAMRHLNGVYTQRYNQLMKKDGSLFRGRYKACLIEADNYLIQVSRYIHLNPVKAKICKKPQDYCWSSYRFFLGLDQSPVWLQLTETLQFFGDMDQKNKYCGFAFGGLRANAVAQVYHRTKQRILLDEQLKTTINNIEKQIYSESDKSCQK